MYRTPVSSSNIKAIGYDLESGILEVEFNSGDVYQYFNISEYLYHGLMNAASKGQFLTDYIKHSYRYQKIS